MPITDDQLVKWFTHHPPHGDQVERYEALRDMGLEFARAIVSMTPGSADQSVAVRKVREAVMNANAAIAIGECDDAPRGVEPPMIPTDDGEAEFAACGEHLGVQDGVTYRCILPIGHPNGHRAKPAR